jgi:hypothetical protein
LYTIETISSQNQQPSAHSGAAQNLWEQLADKNVGCRGQQIIRRKNSDKGKQMESWQRENRWNRGTLARNATKMGKQMKLWHFGPKRDKNGKKDGIMALWPETRQIWENRSNCGTLDQNETKMGKQMESWHFGPKRDKNGKTDGIMALWPEMRQKREIIWTFRSKGVRQLTGFFTCAILLTPNLESDKKVTNV